MAAYDSPILGCTSCLAVLMDCNELGWNPVGSASAHSTLAGVVSSLVFAGIVVLLSDKTPSPQRTRALILFCAAFFALAFDAFLFAVIAGEQICARAWTETMTASALLGLGALGIFSGVAWLLEAFGDAEKRATRLTMLITYTLAFIVVLELQATAQDYIDDLEKTGTAHVPSWAHWMVRLYTPALLVVILFVRLISRIGQRSEAATDRSASRAAYVTVAYVLAISLIAGLSEGSPTTDWEPRAHIWIILTATVTTLALPGLGLLAQLLALPVSARQTSSAPISPATTGADSTADRLVESADPAGQ